MTQLLMRLWLMACLILAGYAVLWLTPPNSYVLYATVLDKHELLMRRAPPRVIFVGGSGIALGIDSERVERALEMPAVNMGVNGGFGLRYILDEVLPYLREGDLVAVVPEYEYFYGLREGGENLLWALRFREEVLFKSFHISLAYTGTFVRELPFFMQTRLWEILSAGPDPIYNRSAFNAWGDFVNHLDLGHKGVTPTKIHQNESFDDSAVHLLDQFAAFAKAAGAEVVVVPPAVAQIFASYGDNDESMRTTARHIVNETSVPMLTQPDEFILPDSCFFDSGYHLNRVGRDIRTDAVIRLLREYRDTHSLSGRSPRDRISRADAESL